jgi:hypothetical protein
MFDTTDRAKRQLQSEYYNPIKQFHDNINKNFTTLQIVEMMPAIDDLMKKQRRLFISMLSTESKVINPMVTGRAGVDFSKNQRNQEVAMKKHDLFLKRFANFIHRYASKFARDDKQDQQNAFIAEHRKKLLQDIEDATASWNKTARRKCLATFDNHVAVTKAFKKYLPKDNAIGRIEMCPIDNRIRLFFNDKPSQEVIDMLKTAKYKYAPTIGCWSNFINQKSVNAAQFIYGFHMKLTEI